MKLIPRAEFVKFAWIFENRWMWAAPQICLFMRGLIVWNTPLVGHKQWINSNLNAWEHVNRYFRRVKLHGNLLRPREFWYIASLVKVRHEPCTTRMHQIELDENRAMQKLSSKKEVGLSKTAWAWCCKLPNLCLKATKWIKAYAQLHICSWTDWSIAEALIYAKFCLLKTRIFSKILIMLHFEAQSWWHRSVRLPLRLIQCHLYRSSKRPSKQYFLLPSLTKPQEMLIFQYQAQSLPLYSQTILTVLTKLTYGAQSGAFVKPPSPKASESVEITKPNSITAHWASPTTFRLLLTITLHLY